MEDFFQVRRHTLGKSKVVNNLRHEDPLTISLEMKAPILVF